MLIFGSRASKIASETLEDKCANCARHTVQVFVFQKYAHLFWIPLFPIGKSTITECSHCKKISTLKESSSTLSGIYHSPVSGVKTPIWTYSGIGVMVVLVTWAIFIDKQKVERNARIILNPVYGDVYEVKKGHDQYTLFKVDDVIEDTVYLFVSQYETNKASGLASLKNKGDDAYSDASEPMLLNDLKSMLEKGEIIDIDRKQ